MCVCATTVSSHCMLSCRTETLAEVLDEYKQFPGLGVHWVMFGPSDRRTRPKGGGVLRHYTRCMKKPHLHVKMIVNTFYVAHIAAHPHNFEFRREPASTCLICLTICCSCTCTCNGAVAGRCVCKRRRTCQPCAFCAAATGCSARLDNLYCIDDALARGCTEKFDELQRPCTPRQRRAIPYSAPLRHHGRVYRCSHAPPFLSHLPRL